MLLQMRRLPLFVAVAAFIIYLGTMGSGLTAAGVPLVGKLAGWDPNPMPTNPVQWLFTLPLCLLPLAWLPLATKLMAAAVASVVLGLLARVVQLLPWDQSWDRAGRLVYLLPVLTACVVCGLNFSFWREATTTPGELLDLLLLAGLVWMLFEFNLRRNRRWLDAAAFVMGLGMIDNPFLIFAVPIALWAFRKQMLAALDHGETFSRKFILRLVGLAAAGFLLYVVLPTMNGLLPHSPCTLVQSWTITLHITKVFVTLPYVIWRADHFAVIAVAICYLVPTLPLLIRTPDEGTHNKSGLDQFQVWLYRILKTCVLLACFWLACDPTPGARQMLHRLVSHMPMLSFDFFNGLGAAYIVGFLLLVFQGGRRRAHYDIPSNVPWRAISVSAATLALVLLAAGLVFRTGSAILHLNFHPLERYGTMAVESLPAGGGVVLSDRPDTLQVFQMALARSGRKDCLAVDTARLPTVAYRAQLERELPMGWLTAANGHELIGPETVDLLEEIARAHHLFYLHPAFGPVIERFYAEPVGSLFELKLRGKDPLDVPPLADSSVQAAEQFWTTQWDKELSAVAPQSSDSIPRGGLAKIGLVPPAREADVLLAQWYSIPLNAWAVQLQRQGRLREAETRLNQALELDSNNVSSRVTLAANTNLQAGVKLGMLDVIKLIGQTGNPDRVTNALVNFGPMDEPSVDYLIGSAFYDSGFLVEAAEYLDRARVLAPGVLAPKLALAGIYNEFRMPNRSLPLIRQMREEVPGIATNQALDLNLAFLESNAWLMQTNRARALEPLKAIAAQFPGDSQVQNRVLSAYVSLGDITNALDIVNAQLADSPNDLSRLDLKAAMLMQIGRMSDALPLLDHVLMMTNLPNARVNRALAQIYVQNFALAKVDLDDLQKRGIKSPLVDYALALEAEHELDTNSERGYLQSCLDKVPPHQSLWNKAHARLIALESAAAAK